MNEISRNCGARFGQLSHTLQAINATEESEFDPLATTPIEDEQFKIRAFANRLGLADQKVSYYIFIYLFIYLIQQNIVESAMQVDLTEVKQRFEKNKKIALRNYTKLSNLFSNLIKKIIKVF